MKESFRRKQESQLKWAGHVERMEGERLTKRADALRIEEENFELCKNFVK